jgi:tyrosyl-tRNA synthetase
LLTTADGGKMGKTAAGAVWLNEEQLPAWDFWQYWRNVDDRDVGRFLRLFTDLPLDEIVRLENLQGAEINAAKVVLANEVTALVRGEAAAQSAESTASATFAGGAGEDLPTLALDAGTNWASALTALGFTPSNGEAKRKIAEGAVKIDGEPVTDPAAPARAGRVSLGKKKHGVLS